METEGKLPSIEETAFACPHCGAYTSQKWYNLYAEEIDEKQRVPWLPDSSTRLKVEADSKLEAREKRDLLQLVETVHNGLVGLLKEKETSYLNERLFGLFLSKCFNCGEYAVWLKDRLLFPLSKEGPAPNIDLPPQIRADFEEARAIVGASPRGAAALLRLAIQKLVVHLEEKGTNLDKDIGSLVSKGLNPTVQKSLDVVRVIGNEAVHPGVLDLKDDRQTAVVLLELVNLIAEQMISNPKKVDAIYGKLPKEKRRAIEKRDEKAKG